MFVKKIPCKYVKLYVIIVHSTKRYIIWPFGTHTRYALQFTKGMKVPHYIISLISYRFYFNNDLFASTSYSHTFWILKHFFLNFVLIDSRPSNNKTKIVTNWRASFKTFFCAFYRNLFDYKRLPLTPLVLPWMVIAQKFINHLPKFL